MTFLFEKKHFSSFRIIIFGFMLVIFAGALLLTLPIATTDGHGALFTDALFTSTSAVCVTGLVLHDTATYWAPFGQFIIMLLIQIGGMGVVTVAVAIAVVSGRKIGLMQRSTMQEAIAAPQVGGIVRLTEFILKMTITIEGLGAAVMAPVFCREFGFLKGIWYAVFHSVSAFCNAGFDLMGVRAAFSSLTTYAGQPVINLAIMFLIVFGGIGFLTWEDITVHGLHFKKYRMPVSYTHLTLPTNSRADFSVPEKVLASMFQSVTPRTAGFNTVELTALTEAGQMMMIILMLIGGSPGSTAGGMKTTTAAVLFASAIAVFRQKEEAHFFGRRVPEDTIKNAATILLMYLVLFLTGGIVISSIEGLPILTCLFETASAIGTVGLSLGITPGLSLISRLILILLMFFGRVGGLTLVFAALPGVHKNVSRFPKEKITVG